MDLDNSLANSHTHLQATQAQAQTQAWRQRVSVPTHDQNNRQTNGRRRTTKAQHHLYASRGLASLIFNSFFVRQKSAIFKVQFFVGSSVVKIPACV